MSLSTQKRLAATIGASPMLTAISMRGGSSLAAPTRTCPSRRSSSATRAKSGLSICQPLASRQPSIAPARLPWMGAANPSGQSNTKAGICGSKRNASPAMVNRPAIPSTPGRPGADNQPTLSIWPLAAISPCTSLRKLKFWTLPRGTAP